MTINLHNLQKDTKVYKTYTRKQKCKNIEKTIKKKKRREHHYTATLRYTSPQFIQLHLSILHSLTITIHYPLICLKTFTFPTALITFPTAITHHTTRHRTVLPCPKLFLKKNPFTALKNLPPF